MLLETHLNIQTPSPLQKLTLGDKHEIWCKRDDALHEIISGNKWRKLRPFLQSLVASEHDRQSLWVQSIEHIASFGGAYSNHLHALGYACFRLGIPFTAFVRAHPDSKLSPTLLDLKAWGSSLRFLTRKEYQQRNKTDFVMGLKDTYNIDHLVPEGGSSQSSLAGVANVMKELKQQDPIDFDLIVLPVASGGTMAGLIKHILEQNLNTAVLGVAVLKGEGYLEQLVQKLLQPESTEDLAYLNATDAPLATSNKWSIIHDERFHCGGYAKAKQHLLDFKHAFFNEHNIMLDNVYNAKSFYALNQMLIDNSLTQFKRILILHTGGLQGNRTSADMS